MLSRHLCVESISRRIARVLAPSRGYHPDRRRVRLSPTAEALEPRLVLDSSATTYTWTALGDGTSFSDPNNWSHVGPLGGGVGVPGVPSPGSNLSFPPLSWLPPNSPTTIDFDGTNGTLPFNLLEIGDSYTLTGDTVSLTGGILVANPSFARPTDAAILLSNVILGRQATIDTEQDSTLTLGGATDTTGVQLTLQGGVTKSGGGQLVIETSSLIDPQSQFALQTFELAGGTVTLGTSMDFSNSLFRVDSGSVLNVAAGAAVEVGSLSGPGIVDLQGTGAAGDTTALTAFTPVGESDQLTGQVIGAGRFTMQGHGTLTLGGIDLGGAGAVIVALGALEVNGPIDAGTLQVGAGTFGGLGSWHFSGPIAFQAGSTFNVAIGGPGAAPQNTELVTGDAASGIDLGNSTLTGTFNYEYEAGDQIVIAAAPRIVGAFQNVINGMVLLNGVPFAVSSSGDAGAATDLVLTAQQSETTTRLSSSASQSHPGQPITFTAAVSTRTAPVSSGTVSFMMGGSVLATLPMAADGTATFTTTSLPLGHSTITAVFGGAGSILGSASTPMTQVVVPYSTATIVTSSVNPARFRQPVTLIATVTADGMPVTSGTVTFTRGDIVIGVAALAQDGTARLTTSSLPRRRVGIQASYAGDPDHYGSVSPVYIQAVHRAATATSLTATQVIVRGRVRAAVVAAVEAVDLAGMAPVGTVAFVRNRRVIGQVRLVGGTATFVLPRRTHGRGRFIAMFHGNPRFGPSTSSLLALRR